MGAGRRPWALSLSLLAHAELLAAVLTAAPATQRAAAPDLLPVELVAPRFLPPPPRPPEPAPQPQPKAAAAPPKAEPARPAPQLVARRPRVVAPQVPPLRAAMARTAAASDQVSDAELAGAARAAGGAGAGAGCDMAAWLQGKLRRDGRVQAALAAARPERPLMVWNGAWVRHGEEAGAGLAQVREAITWEVGFAPAACRTQPVHGLVVLSLADAPGAPRLVLGRASWRWSDLLFAPAGAAG